jgi:glutamyl/glutaminyl-tRNA synthetase
LDWINSAWIKKLSIDELYKLSFNFWQEKEFYQNASTEKKSEEFIKKVLTIEQDRLSKLTEVGENNKFFFANEINYEKDLLRWKESSDEQTSASLENALEILNNISEENWTRENLEKILLEAAEKPARNATHSVAGGRGDLLWPIRAAISGEKKSPSPFEVAWVLGKNETLERIKKALEKIKS